MVDWIAIPANKAMLALSEVEELKRISDALCAAVERQFAEKYEGGVCYVTLASPSYEWGLRVLLRSLREVSQVPMIVISARRWNFACEEPDVLFVEVPGLVNPSYRSDRDEFAETLTKLWVFGLTCFRRITFVDADCLVLRSIDDLFDADGFLAGPDYVLSAAQEGFNTGLFSFQPTRELRDLIFERAQHTDSADGGDQGVLNELLRSRVRLLPPEYDVLRHFHHFAGVELKRSEMRLIHYIVKKPWELSFRETGDVALSDLDDLWTKQLTRDELLSLIAWWRRTQYTPLLNQEDYIRSRKRRQRRNRAFIAAGMILTAVVFFGVGYVVAGGAPWFR
jgi:Glycosyl transferase family 8